jgi:hypothetical protein
MEPDEAVQLLLRVSGESNDSSDGFAKSVAKELSYLPVAINLTATLSRKLGVDFEVLLGYLQTEKDDVRPILGMKILSPNASHVINKLSWQVLREGQEEDGSDSRLWGRDCTDTIRAMEVLSRKDQGFAH